MLINIEIFELDEISPIISLTNSTHVRSSVKYKSKDFNTDDEGENYKIILIEGNILLGNAKEDSSTIESEILYKESLEVKNLINWALLPADDVKCYKKIIITTKLDEDAEQKSEEVIEYAYIAKYKEMYDQVVGVNSGLVPFSIVIKELIKLDEEDSGDVLNTATVDIDDSNTSATNTSIDKERFIKTEYAAIFEGADTTSKVLKIAKYGEKVIWKKSNSLNGFVTIEYEGVKGWIQDSFLHETQPGNKDFTTIDKMKTTSALNFRKLPDIDDNIITIISVNTEVQLIGTKLINSDGIEWIGIKYGGDEGWVAWKYLGLINNELTTTNPPSTSVNGNFPTDAWLYITPAVTNGTDDRSVSKYRAVLDSMNVETNARYTPRNGNTYCNILVWDATYAMNAEIPHWINSNTGEIVGVGKGSELDANATQGWLDNHGVRYGWTACSKVEAIANANEGKPTVVSWKNTSGIGHIAMISPQLYGETGVMITQAGGKNLNYDTINAGFGSAYDKVQYYKHD